MRFDFYSRGDTPDTTGGDASWTGIDMTRDKPNVQPGFYTLGQNTRCRTGRIKQRRGTFAPGDFNPPAGFGNFQIGSGVYRNPNGDEVLLLAPSGAGYTWHVEYGKDPVKILYSSTTNAATTQNNGVGQVEFVQAFDKVLLLRRNQLNNENIVWNGVNLPATGDNQWQKTVLSADGNTLVPGVLDGEPFMDRVIFYLANRPDVGGRDIWYMSDIEDYTSYDPVFQSERTNAAEADFITRILSYYKGSVVIFKSQSIHMATLNPTYPVSITQRILNRTIGSYGKKMPLMIGGDVLFMSVPQGFYSLAEIIQDQITTLPVPISEPIQDVIDQINWGVTAVWGCSAALDNYAFFGVALGRGATRLNTILVYDTQRKQWESAGDTWADPTFQFNALHVTNYESVHRVFAIDYVNSAIYLLYEGINDELNTGIFTVPFKMETRGYTGDDPLSFKRFGRGIIGISTYDPSITVTALTDGFNEEKNLTPLPLTKDRTQFYQHGHAPFDVLTDDPTEQKRKDYSIVNVDNFCGDDFEDLPVGPITFIPATSPPVLGDQQESLERFLVRSFGRWCAFRVENNNGSCEVTSVGVESTRAMNTGKTAA